VRRRPREVIGSSKIVSKRPIASHVLTMAGYMACVSQAHILGILSLPQLDSFTPPLTVGYQGRANCRRFGTLPFSIHTTLSFDLRDWQLVNFTPPLLSIFRPPVTVFLLRSLNLPLHLIPAIRNSTESLRNMLLYANTEVMPMKLALILVALMLIGVAAAEREYAIVNGFNVSFDLNQTYDVVIDTGDGINGSVTIRTFEGSFTCNLVRYPKPLSLNSTWLRDNLIALPINGVPAEQIKVDKAQGIFIISMSSDTGEPIFGAIYYPDIRAGNASTFVSVTSTLPFYTTADLLRTLHVDA